MKKTVKIITAAVLAAALGIFLWSALCAEAEPSSTVKTAGEVTEALPLPPSTIMSTRYSPSVRFVVSILLIITPVLSALDQTREDPPP